MIFWRKFSSFLSCKLWDIFKRHFILTPISMNPGGVSVHFRGRLGSKFGVKCFSQKQAVSFWLPHNWRKNLETVSLQRAIGTLFYFLRFLLT